MKTAFLCMAFVLYTASAVKSQEVQETNTYYACTPEEFYQMENLYTPIDILHPDYALLDAAIFHVTNEARQQEKLPPFRYFNALHKAAELHSTLMIDLDFYGHYNNIDRYYYFPLDRVREFDKAIPLISENVAEYPLMKSTTVYCPEKQKDGTWIFLNCKTHELLSGYTYLDFAKTAVDKWLNSPPHRRNIMDESYQYLGCAARFSKDPFTTRKMPFARLTQNFGGYIK